MWDKIKKPLAATVGVTIGGVCALVVSQAEVASLDPSSIVFVSVLLVDISSAEAFYVTATFRIIGTLFGLLAGAGFSGPDSLPINGIRHCFCVFGESGRR